MYEAEAWAQHMPLTVSEGIVKLERLAAKLTPAERDKRALGLRQARRFLMNAAQGGGVGPTKASFPPGTPIRIDIEVLSGIAFVPD